MSANKPAPVPDPTPYVSELPTHTTPAQTPAPNSAEAVQPPPPPLEIPTPETPNLEKSELLNSENPLAEQSAADVPVSPNAVTDGCPPVPQPEGPQPGYLPPTYQPAPPDGSTPPQGYQYPLVPAGQVPLPPMQYQYPQPQYYYQPQPEVPYQLQAGTQMPLSQIYQMPSFPSDATIDPNWEPEVGIHFAPPPPKPTSVGYIPGAVPEDYNCVHDAELIYKALTEGLTLDTETLIHVVPYLDPLQLEEIRGEIYREHDCHVPDLVEKLFPSSFKDGLRAVLYGPLYFDAWLLNRAMEGFGTKTYYLNLVLLGRKNGDIEAIKDAYHLKYKRHLVADLRKELSGDVEALFMNALDCRRWAEDAPIDDAAVQNDIMALCEAMVGKPEANMVSEILVTRSDKMLERIISGYGKAFPGKPLEEVIKKKFKGNMQESLQYILQGVDNRALRDARLLEGTMKGLGTRDEELMYRIVKLHWEKEHLKDVKDAYYEEYPKRVSLVQRIKDETRGDQEKFLLELLEIA
ncbi:hypothetical protein RUND412_004417 [Rhizina undulata]